VVDRRLSPLDVRVLAAIAIHVNDKHRAWPSQEWVAQLVGVRRETANRAIGRLADLGYLRTERVSRYGGYWRNEYEVLYPAFAPPPHPQVHGTGDLRRTFRVRHRREST
jgi:predicted transcriptional regulator